jgi:hypothetical protein
MKPVEEFVRELFDARITEEKRMLASRDPYRQKYFAPDCFWDSRKGTLEMIESEDIVSIDESALKATVITAFVVPYAKSGHDKSRLRYHLKVVGDSWLVEFVEHECLACNGQGDESCTVCRGKHWISPK